MKTLTVFIVSMFFSIQISAQEQSNDQVVGQERSPVQWIHYLSEKEKIEIGRKLVMEKLRRLEATGELYEEIPQREISFPGSFKKLNPASTDAGSAAATAGGGNVTCDINVQSPHAGSGPSNSWVVKAKSSGSCSYEPVFGELPPTIGWDLTMYLLRFDYSHGSPDVPSITPYTASHPRNSISPSWSSSSAQVFSSTCTNGRYSHHNLVWVTPPVGWTYTGPQPIFIPTTRTNDVASC